MSETTIALLLLSVLTLCAVILTITLLFMSFEMRRVLHRAYAALGDMQHLLRSAGHATQRVDFMVEQVYQATSGIVERITGLKRQMTGFLQGHAGNGSRVGPRRRHGNNHGGK